MRKGAKFYQQVGAQGKVEDASPHRLIQMMFESAIEAMNVTKGALAEQNVLLKVAKVNKAFNIVESLRGCLNMEEGGEMAENLDSLYEHTLYQIMQVNATNNPDLCDHVIKILSELLDAWNQIPVEQHQLTSLTPEQQGKVPTPDPAVSPEEQTKTPPASPSIGTEPKPET